MKKLPNFNEQIELSKMKLDKLKDTLKKYKDKKIYDYKSNNYFYKLFTSFYDKKEAIDFLMSKIDSNIDNLKDRIDPTNRRITIKNIEDTIECLNQFKEFIKLNTSSQILDYIEKLDKDTIDKFISYSKIYPSIIELDRNDDIFSFNTFEAVDKIITNASLIFKQDNEDFYYKDKDEKKQQKLRL